MRTTRHTAVSRSRTRSEAAAAAGSENAAGWLRAAAKALEELRQRRPLVHNITNYVAMNFTANALLAIGASPVMAHAEQEVEEMVGLASAVVLNIGTLSPAWIRAMQRAARVAQTRGIPVVVDPVGAGATRFRTRSARRLMACGPAIVRGNASEILALYGEQARTRGVDAQDEVTLAESTADRIASEARCVVAVTGPVDYVTDGRHRARVANGHPLMGRITASGCVATALMGAFAAVSTDAFVAALATLVAYGICGERAARGSPGPGTFASRLLDELASITPENILRCGRISEA